MSKSKSKLNNYHLLSQIEKMLSGKNPRLIWNNSFLGFCAKLIALKPKISPLSKDKIWTKLTKTYPFSDIGAPFSPQTPSFSLLSLKNLNFKVASLLVSLLLLTAAASQISFSRNFSSPKTPLQSSNQSAIQGENNLQKWILPQIKNLGRGESYRILREDCGFKLIEYILPDGSTIKILQGLI